MRLDMPFNLDATLCCGQVFSWERRKEWWYGVVGDRVLKVSQINRELEFDGNVNTVFLKRYFSLDHDLQQISCKINKDTHVQAALKKFWGLRIVRQEPWECLISFICATYKSVAAIKHMLHNLSVKFGKKLVFEGCDFFSFPRPEKLAGATLGDLGDCGLGYRAKYVLETSKRINASKFDLEALKNMPYEQAKVELCQFPGVGLKVADCILLFSLEKLEAFPIDVWIKRIMLKYYFRHFSVGFVKDLRMEKSLSNAEYEILSRFGREYFGDYAGYAQEYLYHYERMNG